MNNGNLEFESLAFLLTQLFGRVLPSPPTPRWPPFILIRVLCSFPALPLRLSPGAETPGPVWAANGQLIGIWHLVLGWGHQELSWVWVTLWKDYPTKNMEKKRSTSLAASSWDPVHTPSVPPLAGRIRKQIVTGKGSVLSPTPSSLKSNITTGWLMQWFSIAGTDETL